MDTLIKQSKYSLDAKSRREPTGTRASDCARLLTTDVFSKIKSAKVLVVGAGGIGCELLKDLVMTGFRTIEVIDLDTIDVSNLNRQFLFRREHVGMSKAEVAKKSVQEFNPAADITSHHGNVKTGKFGPDYVKQFTLVMNALDNLSARRHVNRLCLSQDVPLIECGTQGYKGQTTVIKKGKFECFECTPKITPTTYPVCTIRDTPSEPVHCVAFAKLMYDLLFGPEDEENMLNDLKLSPNSGESPNVFARRIFTHIFDSGIRERISRKEAGTEADSPDGKKADVPEWGPKGPPMPLVLDEILSTNSPHDTTAESSGLRNQSVLSVEENCKEFLSACVSIVESGKPGQLLFDKEDELAVRFVSSATNLRMTNYHLDRLSQFAIKGIAGNIVHAIATTNAVVAGLVVLQAVKIASGYLSECHGAWVSRCGPRPVQRERLSAPNTDCYVCQKQRMQLTCDLREFTLRQLFDVVLKRELGMIQPSVDFTFGDIAGFIEEDDEDLESWGGDSPEQNRARRDNYFSRPLGHETVKICHGMTLCVDDSGQDFKMNLQIRDCPKMRLAPEFKDVDDVFILEGEKKSAPKLPPKAAPREEQPGKRRNGTKRKAPTASHDSILIMDSDEETQSAGQSTTSVDSNGQTTKKIRIE
eukprot:7629_1